MTPNNAEFSKNADGTISVTVPSKENKPTSNEEAMQRFGPAIEKGLAALKEAKLDKSDEGEATAKKIRRNLRKLGYTLAGNRTRGVVTF